MSDTSYIIKRVIIGVAIALCIMFIKNFLILNVSAREISSATIGSLDVAINGTDNSYTWDVTDGSWENWGSGYLLGAGAMIKTNGTSTSGFASVRSVLAYSGNQTYQCKIGSTSNNNSTYFNQTFTFECPMIMGQYGLQQLVFVFAQPNNVIDFTMKLQVNSTMTFVKDDPADSSSTAINNQISNDNTNTTNIINNQNDNTQDIIDNQNDNTQQQIESQQVCNVVDKSSIKLDNKNLGSGGQLYDNNSYGVTDYYSITSNTIITPISTWAETRYTCFYNINKSLISCIANRDLVVNTNLTIPSDASYVRFSIQKEQNKPQFKICKNGNQAIADGQQQLNDTLNNDNVDSATSTGSSFFLDFADHTNPLLDIVLFPIRLLDSADDSCQPIPITYLNKTINLPCGNTIFWDKDIVSDFKIWWNLFVGGIAIYYLCLKLFKIINDSFDPFKDPMNQLGGL